MVKLQFEIDDCEIRLIFKQESDDGESDIATRSLNSFNKRALILVKIKK